MKRLSAALCLSALLCSAALEDAKAAFLEPYWSARVAALGGAFTAISNDATASFYNPAAAVGMDRKQASFSYAKLFSGLDGVKLGLNHLAYMQPLMNRQAVLGFGWGSFNADALYREDTFALSYAQSIKGLLGKNYGGDLSVGMTVKYLGRSFSLNDYSASDPVFKDGAGMHTFALDLHFLSVPSPKYLPGVTVGLTIRNVNRPNIGYQDTENLPTEYDWGLAYRWRNVVFPVDIVQRNGGIRPKFGMEWWLMNDHLAVRMGGDIGQVATGFGYQYDLTKHFSVVFDYAFMWPLQLDGTTGSHRATLGVKF